MISTYRRIEERLRCNGLLFRFADADADQPPAEGAFGLCGFWAVDHLARRGELQQATERFEHLLSPANDVGLFGEQVDPTSGSVLGNFPQTYTHVGLMAAASSLAKAAPRPREAA